MTTTEKQALGTIGWFDLTVNDAPAVRDFYASVVGWQSQELDMGGYADFVMTSTATGEAVAGVCHARGTNADIPPQWLLYVVVDDLDASLQRCTEGGGSLVTGIKDSGDGGRYSVIRDPAGAVLALMEQGTA